MKFSNSFPVSLSPAQAWPVLLDVQAVTPCMPGAQVTEVVDEKTFKGTIAVKLGPVALLMNCVAEFEQVDPAQFAARINAQGVDAKGRGSSKSKIDFRLVAEGDGSRVMVDTELQMSGALAQYGRAAGIVQSVASQLVLQFAKNLEALIDERGRTGVASEPAAAATESEAPVGADVAAAPPAASTPRPAAPAAPAQAISGFAVLFAALRAFIRGLFVRGK